MQTVKTISRMIELRELLETMTDEKTETALDLVTDAIIYASKDMVEENRLLLIEEAYDIQQSLYYAILDGRIEINNFDEEALDFSGKIRKMIESNDDPNIKYSDFSNVCEYMKRYFGKSVEKADKYEDIEELIKAILDEYAGRA